MYHSLDLACKTTLKQFTSIHLSNLINFVRRLYKIEQQNISMATLQRIPTHPFNFLLSSRQQQNSPTAFFNITTTEKNMDKAGKALRR